MRILRDPIEAEDVVQEAFLALHETAAVARPDAWLTRVVRNRAIDRLRGRRDHAEVDDVPTELQEEDDGAATVASWLPGLVDGLPEPYASAVRQVDLQGLPQTAYAAAQGLSLSGARSRVQRGRAMLHERLLACCPVRFESGVVIDTGAAGCAGCGSTHSSPG